MTASYPGPPIRTVLAARRALFFEAAEMFAAPFRDLKDGLWGFALFDLLLWPVALPVLFVWFLKTVIHVWRHGDQDEALDRMWDKFADAVTGEVFRHQPGGSETGTRTGDARSAEPGAAPDRPA